MNKSKTISMFCGAVLLFGSANAMDTAPVQNPDGLGEDTAQVLPVTATDFEENYASSLTYSFQYDDADVVLKQGAVISVAEDTAFGKAKNIAQIVSRVKNSNKINAVSPLFLAHWSDISTIGEGNSNPYIGNAMASLKDYSVFYAWSSDKVIPCTVSLDFGYVSLLPLEQKIMQSKGNVYYRNLNDDISDSINYEDILALFKDVVGRPAEAFTSLKEPIFALLDKNTEERTDKFFNSELTAYCYKKLGIISQDINCSNIIPAELSSSAGSRDILNGLAGSDTLLHSFKYVDPLYTQCCGIFKNLKK